MNGVNESDENGKILNDPDVVNKLLDESRKTGQTSETKMIKIDLIELMMFK
ncbi:hypothetical protein Hanom_Chr14g01304871 [Helianthus anomalus]